VPKAVLDALRQCMKDETASGHTNGLRPAVSGVPSPDKTKASRFKHMETLQFKKVCHCRRVFVLNPVNDESYLVLNNDESYYCEGFL
jgi:hypothetical protein